MNDAKLAGELLAAYDGASRLVLPSARDPAFDLARAYAVAEDIRRRRLALGEKPRGYKIGFTNRIIWSRYGVHAPIWGPLWDTTVRELDGTSISASLAGLVQPRIEPEVMFGFGAAPEPGMGMDELAACIAWVAHGFEIVHTHFDDWRFQAADTVADFALHGRLFVGPKVEMQAFGDGVATDLARLEVELRCDQQVVDRGQGEVVLDGPLHALRTWLHAMHRQPQGWKVMPGDIVSTGTLTDAWPLAAGQQWRSELSDPRLPGLTLRLEP